MGRFTRSASRAEARRRIYGSTHGCECAAPPTTKVDDKPYCTIHRPPTSRTDQEPER